MLVIVPKGDRDESYFSALAAMMALLLAFYASAEVRVAQTKPPPVKRCDQVVSEFKASCLKSCDIYKETRKTQCTSACNDAGQLKLRKIQCEAGRKA
ncbi:hypothetical protein [Variovorax sp. PBS-H4]|uniref:hypothetical protein n=1 Tax=Variovorax sp. PBS-H4 TaxID=434008 RepID=UPI0013A52FE3|nr:hypothetical protein [Variovorax sp. PBS-H4]